MRKFSKPVDTALDTFSEALATFATFATVPAFLLLPKHGNFISGDSHSDYVEVALL